MGLSAGLLLGVVYLGILHWMGVQVSLHGHDVTVPFVAFLTISYSILGYLIGRQAARAAHHRNEAAASRTRRLHLEAAHAHDVQAARLDSLGRLALAASKDLRLRLEGLEADHRSISLTVSPGGGASCRNHRSTFRMACGASATPMGAAWSRFESFRPSASVSTGRWR